MVIFKTGSRPGAIHFFQEPVGIADFLETGVAAEATPNLFVCDLDDSAIEGQFPGLPRTDIAAGIRKTLKQFQKMAALGKVKI